MKNRSKTFFESYEYHFLATKIEIILRAFIVRAFHFEININCYRRICIHGKVYKTIWGIPDALGKIINSVCKH